MKLGDYAIRIELLPRKGGGGFLVTAPDLPGCVGDGEGHRSRHRRSTRRL